MTRVFDLHAHVSTPACEKLLDGPAPAWLDPFTRFSGPETAAYNATQFAALAGKLTDPAQRIADMDRTGIDVQAISAAPPQFYYWADPALGRRLARLQNEHLAEFAREQPVLDRALQTIPAALKVLDERRDDLVTATTELGRFGAMLTDTIGQSREDLVRILHDAGPILERLADAGPSMTRGLSGIVTYPFPFETIELWQRGDYANLTAIFDLTLSRIDASVFTGTRWECHLTWLEMQWGRTIGQFPSPCTGGGPNTPGNPLVAPYRWDQGP